MQSFYYLDGKIPVKCRDIDEWSQKMDWAHKHVARDEVDGYVISTVFLGIDHRFTDNGKPPILFETMIFGRDDKAVEDYQERYTTWEDAEWGHRRAIHHVQDLVRAGK